ncbi:replication protein A 32 kDa subunit-like [Parambassis ranga]|uniref:Replication protein A 32 kDa subunit-like n=1 Tax=Parambassis ranga TaxID=210632 RepID=A0A6P7HZR9_9TELE|nr:replication protein A 32 kDa subunit-like [Parambassis ranga]
MVRAAMWSAEPGQCTAGITSHKESQQVSLAILPCTVSQLLSASEVGHDTFAFCGWELNQVSVVGVIRGYSPCVTNIHYYVDDMTGPPLSVKQWVSTEDCKLMTAASPGTYVKVIGSLRNFKGQRLLLAMDIRRISDLNEISSHMLEVVYAHMSFFGKVFDVNMNTPARLLPARCLSTIQDQVLHVVKKFSYCGDGISFDGLKTELDYLSMKDIRTSLSFLINEGHVFSTIDKDHFKSTEH